MGAREQRSKERKSQFRKAIYTSAQALSTFLKGSAKSHSGCYFHYTTVDALKGMYKNGCLLLTRATELNDLNEMKFRHEEKNLTYVASFSTLRSESVAMWALYGVPVKKGIRIRFPKKTIEKLLHIARGEDKTNFAYEVTNPKRIGKRKKRVRVKEAYFTDVVYKGNNSLTWHNNCVVGKTQQSQMLEDPMLLGQIKDDLWRYENEVRLIVKLESGAKKYPPKIAIPLQRLLKNMSVVLGPCFDNSVETELIKQIKDVEKVKFQESVCTRKIRFPKYHPCKGCKCCNKVLKVK